MAFIPHQFRSHRNVSCAKGLIKSSFAQASKLQRGSKDLRLTPCFYASSSASTSTARSLQQGMFNPPFKTGSSLKFNENLLPVCRHSSEQPSSDLSSRNVRVSPGPEKQPHSRYLLDSSFMPHFGATSLNFYTMTRKYALKQAIFNYYGCDDDLFSAVLKKHPEILYCSISDVEQCLNVFADMGFRKEELLRGSHLLLQNSSSLLAQKQLFEDLGLLCCPKIGFIRLYDLMEVSEQELKERGLLPAQPSVMEQLLSKVGEEHVADREMLLSTAQPQSPLKYIYYEALAGLLAQRFDVSLSDTKRVLKSYQPSYKPLRHYYIICDLITRKLGVNFHHVCEVPELLDIFPVAALSLMSRHPTMCSVSTPHLLSKYPGLTFGSPDLLTRWVELLSEYEVASYRVTPLVQWVLRQDMVELAQLVLMFLHAHPFWSEIKKSTYLFEIFANPSIMDKLMNSRKKKLQKRPKNASAGSTPSSCTTQSSFSSASNISPASVCNDSPSSSTTTATKCQSATSDHSGSPSCATYENKPDSSNCPASESNSSSSANHTSSQSSDRLATGAAEFLNSSCSNAEEQYHAPRHCTKMLKHGARKVRPPNEVFPYLKQYLGVSSAQVAGIGCCIERKSSLPSVAVIVSMLTEAGFTRSQMSVALPIFSADPELVREELLRLDAQPESYVRYWKDHPNGLNLLLYHVRSSVVQRVPTDPVLDDETSEEDVTSGKHL